MNLYIMQKLRKKVALFIVFAFLFSMVTPAAVLAESTVEDVYELEESALAGGGETISGTVTDEGGQPIPGVEVFAYNDDFFSEIAITDQSGNYVISGIETQQEYFIDYYPAEDSIYLPKAETVVTGVGGTIKNVSLTTGGIIKGRVVNEAGAPIPDVEVWAHSAEESYVDTVYTDEDGNFQLTLEGNIMYSLQLYTYELNYMNYKLENISADKGEIKKLSDIVLENGGSIKGKVVDEAGQALAGVDIGVYGVGDYFYDKWGFTDENGNFEIGGLKPGLEYEARFNLEGSNYIPKLIGSIIVDKNQIETINVTLPAGGTVKGRVLNESGKAIPNVDVYVEDSKYFNSRYATTDENGYYEVTGLDPSHPHKVSFAAWGQNYIDKTVRNVTVVTNQPKTVNTTLKTGVILKGRVTDGGGTPVQDLVTIDVFTKNGQYYRYGETDILGYYEIKGLDPAFLYNIELRTWSNYISQNLTRVNVEGGKTLNVIMPVGGNVKGYVTDQSGQALENVEVSAHSPNTDSYISGQTDSNGYYELLGLDPGLIYDIEFYLWDSNLLPKTTKNVKVFKNQFVDVNVNLEKGRFITGRVVDENGTSIPEADVVLYESNTVFSWGTTDEEGYYSVLADPVKTYDINAYPPQDINLVPEKFPNINGASTGVDIALKQGGAITGKVTLESGQPAKNTEVWAYDRDMEKYRYAITDGNGNYTIKGIDPSLTFAVDSYDYDYVSRPVTNITVAKGETKSGVNLVLKAKPTQVRLSGTNRYATAVAISKEGWPLGTDTVILARGDSFADALAGVPLAAKYDAPILLTPPTSLDTGVLQEIQRLKPKKVYILGGKGAVSEAIENTLRNTYKYDVKRLAGSNRFDTAAKIAYELGNEGKAIIGFGLNFPDVLAVSSVAAAEGIPILLTGKDTLDPATQKALADLKVKETIIIGGEGVISKAVASKLPSPTRLAGKNRFETAIKIAKYFDPFLEKVYVASGMNYPDALAGAALAAKTGSPILLVEPTQLPPAAGTYLGQISDSDIISSYYILGGNGAVSTKVADLIK